MIKTENVTIDGRDFVRTYSDAGRYVERSDKRKNKDGEMVDFVRRYTEALDPSEHPRTYTEGDLIPETEATAEEILSILTGGDA